MSVTLHRTVRTTRRRLRRSGPAVVSLCILAALVGGTLAGVLAG
ncbi:hypothetical protein [Arthrobacter terrae]|nr:hypothetical protein [Arthrobacter terrae]